MEQAKKKEEPVKQDSVIINEELLVKIIPQSENSSEANSIFIFPPEQLQKTSLLTSQSSGIKTSLPINLIKDKLEPAKEEKLDKIEPLKIKLEGLNTFGDLKQENLKFETTDSPLPVPQSRMDNQISLINSRYNNNRNTQMQGSGTNNPKSILRINSNLKSARTITF